MPRGAGHSEGWGGGSARFPSSLDVTCYDLEQESWGGINPTWQRTTFQGQPAYKSGHSARHFRYSEALYFQRDGVWFSLSATVPSSVDSLPPVMYDYFNTFRFVPPKPPDNSFSRDEATPPGT